MNCMRRTFDPRPHVGVGRAMTMVRNEFWNRHVVILQTTKRAWEQSKFYQSSIGNECWIVGTFTGVTIFS